jgi:hypothetical protein
MSDHGSRGPLQLPSRGLSPQMLPDQCSPSRDRKEEAATFVAVLGTGLALARRRVSPQVPPQPECSAQIIFKEEGALQWQQDEAPRHRPEEEAEAVFHQQEDEEDVGPAREGWPAYTR